MAGELTQLPFPGTPVSSRGPKGEHRGMVQADTDSTRLDLAAQAHPEVSVELREPFDQILPQRTGPGKTY